MTYGPARARYERRKRLRQRRMANAGFWNVLSGLFIISTILLSGWFAWIFFIRDSTFNPANVQITTQQIAETQVGLTAETQENESKIGLKIPTLLTIPIEPGTNIGPIPIVESDYTFDIQAEPQNISANLFKADRNCSWMGVAGQTFDLQGRPVPGITVQVTGPLYGKEIRFMSLTGAAPWYGEAGYEVFLGDTLFDSSDDFEVRLLDQNGKSLSPHITFSTSSDCAKNLVIINFHQIK